MKINTKIIVGVLLIVVVIVITMLAIVNGTKKEPVESIPEDAGIVVTGTSPVSTFAWRYEPGVEDSDGLPKTVVFLDTAYENGKVITIQVEEVQGSCNKIDPAGDDKDMAKGTTKIQCYAAGFGEQYKIVKGIESYQVVRKHVEEGDPDVKPTVFQYEKIAELPLFQ